MTSKGNPTPCRYAYSQCPNDPESLINYLNNHNGGFFRFFGQPEGSGQEQNLEQFYSYLAGQYNQANQQPYQPQNYGYPYMPNPFAYPYYGPSYREQNTFRNAKDIESQISATDIEERIQNKPGTDALEDEKEKGSKWLFPDEAGHKKEDKPKRQRRPKAKKPKPERPTRGDRGGSPLKFPDDKGPAERPDFNREPVRRPNSLLFPESHHFIGPPGFPSSTPVNLDGYDFDHKHNFFVKRPRPENNDGTETLYVVRGNGDPNHPEIIKVRPGQSPVV
ncbi:uncharacterized protein LOC142982343 [Anticarsia gemmatalis]|uniref:uncharacterized protein LOC142982343 n=1 Tax=Anticarsia gemmatalis TaxID=129554 RepID=UPI003F766316